MSLSRVASFGRVGQRSTRTRTCQLIYKLLMPKYSNNYDNTLLNGNTDRGGNDIRLRLCWKSIKTTNQPNK